MSPTAITAEAKVMEHEFCLILLVWLSKIVLLSEVALGIQCCLHVHTPAVREGRTAQQQQQQQPCRVSALTLTKLDQNLSVALGCSSPDWQSREAYPVWFSLVPLQGCTRERAVSEVTQRTLQRSGRRLDQPEMSAEARGDLVFVLESHLAASAQM